MTAPIKPVAAGPESGPAGQCPDSGRIEPQSGAAPARDRDSIHRHLKDLGEVLDAESAERFLAVLKADWPKTLREAAAALQAGDLARLRRLAHYLAGGALQVGAAELAGRCRALEAEGMDRQRAGILLAELDLQVSSLLREL